MDGQNFYQQPVEPVVPNNSQKPGNGLAIGALIVGIASILLSCCGGGFLGIPGLIMGILANKKNKSGIATGAIVTSIIGIVLFVIFIIVVVITAATGYAIFDFADSYYYY